MPRVMPKAGFYVRQKTVITTIFGEVLPASDCDIVYTTGFRGGGGHKYCRQMTNDHPSILNIPLEQFHTLQWTSVPGKKELEEVYHYAETLEEARELLKTLPYRKYSKD